MSKNFRVVGMVRALDSRRSHIIVKEVHFVSRMSKISMTGLLMSLSVRHIRSRERLATVDSTGHFFDMLKLGKVVGVFSGPMTSKVILRVDFCPTQRKWTLLPVSSPVLVKSVQIDEGLAAGAVGAPIEIRRLRAYSRFCCHFRISGSSLST
jgi:hypothetical protein